jgi:predicted nucleic acid-binding protein
MAGFKYDETACISSITEAELQYGVEKSRNGKALSSSPGRIPG